MPPVAAGYSGTMADRFLSPPFRGGHGAGRSESRILRDRQTAASRAADNALGRQPPYASARQLVQVFNGGSMGAAADLYYFTHPVLATGAETEGAAATLTTDTETTIPVVFLGGAPSVGDYATAYAVGGRWCAEIGGSGPPSFDEIACGCTITDSVLMLTITGPVFIGWCFCFPEAPITVSLTFGTPPAYTGIASGWFGTFATGDRLCSPSTYLALLVQSECTLLFFQPATESQICGLSSGTGATITCSPLNIKMTEFAGDGPDGCGEICGMTATITS